MHLAGVSGEYMSQYDKSHKKTVTHSADAAKRVKHPVKGKDKDYALDHEDTYGYGTEASEEFAKYCGRKPKVAPPVVGPTDAHRVPARKGGRALVVRLRPDVSESPRHPHHPAASVTTFEHRLHVINRVRPK